MTGPAARPGRGRGGTAAAAARRPARPPTRPSTTRCSRRPSSGTTRAALAGDGAAGLDAGRAARRGLRALVASQLRPTWDARVARPWTCCGPCPRPRTWRSGGSGTAGRSRATGTGCARASRRSPAGTTRSPRPEAGPAASASRPGCDGPGGPRRPAVDGRVAAGRRGVRGEVTAVERTYTEGRRPMPRPLVTVATTDLPQAEPGARAYARCPARSRPSRRRSWRSPAPGRARRRARRGSRKRPAPRGGCSPCGSPAGWAGRRRPARAACPSRGSASPSRSFADDPRRGPELPDTRGDAVDPRRAAGAGVPPRTRPPTRDRRRTICDAGS